MDVDSDWLLSVTLDQSTVTATTIEHFDVNTAGSCVARVLPA